MGKIGIPKFSINLIFLKIYMYSISKLVAYQWVHVHTFLYVFTEGKDTVGFMQKIWCTLCQNIFIYWISFREKCFPPGTFHCWMIKNTSQKTQNEFSGLWYFQIWTKLERNQSLNIKGNGNAKCIALPFDLTVYVKCWIFIFLWNFKQLKVLQCQKCFRMDENTNIHIPFLYTQLQNSICVDI